MAVVRWVGDAGRAKLQDNLSNQSSDLSNQSSNLSNQSSDLSNQSSDLQAFVQTKRTTRY